MSQGSGSSARDDDRHVQFGANATNAGPEARPPDAVDAHDDADEERRSQRNA